ncbi:MAG TPA: hypothetical protein VGN13_04735 [Solirubrobacteraceae bacterium]|jgi:hypothetical protein
MRSPKLIAIVAGAAGALALAPGGASAAHHGSAVNPCRLTMVAEPRFLTSGESAELGGQLLCTNGAPTSGQPLTVYAHVTGTPGSQVLGSTTTGAGGFYSILAPSLTADTSFYASAPAGHSATRVVHVAPQVTLKGPPENVQLLTGERHGVTFSGSVDPLDEGAEVLLQRESATSSEDWLVIKQGTVGAGGAYSLTHNFGRPGDANLRVVVRPHRNFGVRAISNTLSYSISQRQNPHLTINSSTFPLIAGQSTRITGTLAGGAGKPVTLLARGYASGFVAVAHGTTDANGNYSFEQSPLQSTYYRVSSASVTSALLFEGVAPVTTAGASAGTVQSGQALTFSGTLTPARVGHTVYLERQNAFGGGYHVVDVGTVAADGSYAIVHVIFGKGAEVFRVKAPGDHVNQASSSAQIPIQVTPAPAGTALRVHPPARLPD